MGKYDPLESHLRQQTADEFTMTFAAVEKVLGEPLPASAERPQWWENAKRDEHKRVQTRAWHNAGFHAFLMAGKRVRFVRVGN